MSREPDRLYRDVWGEGPSDAPGRPAPPADLIAPGAPPVANYPVAAELAAMEERLAQIEAQLKNMTKALVLIAERLLEIQKR